MALENSGKPEAYDLTHSDALRFLHVNRRTALRCMARGDWPRHINLRGPGQTPLRRYRRSDLEAFAEARRINADTDRINRAERAAVGL